MKVLVFDTETTGLPQRNEQGRSPSIYESHLWPHIIQLSYILYDTNTHKMLVNHDHVIKLSEDVEISEKSVEMHGITRERSMREGMDIHEALELFHICMLSADMVIAHNLAFDRQMILVECIRNNRPGPFKFKTPEQFFCTMKSTVELCRIEAISKKNGEKYFKYPTMSELHEHLFHECPQNTHNSLVDILICLRCFVYIIDGVDIRTKNRSFRTLYKSICPG
jgi:DNA polymerase III epsilon subunit-like protein